MKMLILKFRHDLLKSTRRVVKQHRGMARVTLQLDNSRPMPTCARGKLTAVKSACAIILIMEPISAAAVKQRILLSATMCEGTSCLSPFITATVWRQIAAACTFMLRKIVCVST